MSAETEYSEGVQAYIARAREAEARRRAALARMRGMKFDTLAVHGLYSAQEALRNQGSVVEPAFFSSAQTYENSDHLEAALANLTPDWVYGRYGSPTTACLEDTLALLEGYGFAGDVSACATGSGMSAVFMATQPFLLNYGHPSDGNVNFVATAQCYGGTFQLFNLRYMQERGAAVRWVRDGLNLDEWASQIDANTRFLYGEMPSNPGLGLVDVAALADLAHAHGLPLIVDATLATPALLRPLQHGADIVVHSVSKVMTAGGFGIAGAVIARRGVASRVGPDAMRADFAAYVKRGPFRDYGPALSPFNALMTLGELRTLRSRVDALSRSALKVARFLEAHPAVESVQYPGLASFPGHAVAARYLWLVDGEGEGGAPVNRYGHLLSFCVKGGPAAARRVLDALTLIFRAADLGRVKSLATIPAISTHRQQGAAGRALAAIPANLIRLSVGAEHPDDLIADLDQALAFG